MDLTFTCQGDGSAAGTASCAEECKLRGKVCDPVALEAAAASLDNCVNILGSLNRTVVQRGQYQEDNTGCGYHQLTGWAQLQTKGASCDAVSAVPNLQRVCSCADPPDPCAPTSVSDPGGEGKWADWGYNDEYRGWYDVQGCGHCGDYCRWVGNSSSGGDPMLKTVHQTSWWSCKLAGSQEEYTPANYFSSFPYVKCYDKLAKKNSPQVSSTGCVSDSPDSAFNNMFDGDELTYWEPSWCTFSPMAVDFFVDLSAVDTVASVTMKSWGDGLSDPATFTVQACTAENEEATCGPVSTCKRKVGTDLNQTCTIEKQAARFWRLVITCTGKDCLTMPRITELTFSPTVGVGGCGDDLFGHYSAGEYCCPASCGQCGGEGCNNWIAPPTPTATPYLYKSVQCLSEPAFEDLVAAVETGLQPAGYCTKKFPNLEQQGNYDLCNSTVRSRICQKYVWRLSQPGTYKFNMLGQEALDVQSAMIVLDFTELARDRNAVNGGQPQITRNFQVSVGPGTHYVSIYGYEPCCTGYAPDWRGWTTTYDPAIPSAQPTILPPLTLKKTEGSSFPTGTSVWGSSGGSLGQTTCVRDLNASTISCTNPYQAWSPATGTLTQGGNTISMFGLTGNYDAKTQSIDWSNGFIWTLFPCEASASSSWVMRLGHCLSATWEDVIDLGPGVLEVVVYADEASVQSGWPYGGDTTDISIDGKLISTLLNRDQCYPNSCTLTTAWPVGGSHKLTITSTSSTTDLYSHMRVARMVHKPGIPVNLQYMPVLSGCGSVSTGMLRLGRCQSTVWEETLLLPKGDLQLTFFSDESSARDTSDRMKIYIDDVLVLTQQNDIYSGNSGDGGVFFGVAKTVAWPGADHVLKVESQSSNGVYHLHMGIMSILAIPEETAEQDLQFGSPSGYTYFPEECVAGHNIILYKDLSIYQCAERCNNNPDCAGFEYGMNYARTIGSYVYRDCQLQSMSFNQPCPGWNLDYYRKDMASACCVTQIEASGIYCDETEGAPCKLRTSKKDTLVAPTPDVNCSTGVVGPADICCAASCGTCGGTGCGSRSGGAANCCVGAITDAKLYCDETGGPPCIMRPFTDTNLPGYTYHKATQCPGYANGDSTKRSRQASVEYCEANPECQAISCPARSTEGCTLRAMVPDAWTVQNGTCDTSAKELNTSRWGGSLEDCKDACRSSKFLQWYQGPTVHWCACFDDCTQTMETVESWVGAADLPVKLYTQDTILPFYAEDCYAGSMDCKVGEWHSPGVTTCKDGFKNGDETGIDCGGTCYPCDVVQVASMQGAWEHMQNLCTETLVHAEIKYLSGWQESLDEAEMKCMNDANCMAFCHHPLDKSTYHNGSLIGSSGFEQSYAAGSGCNRCFLKRFQVSSASSRVKNIEVHTSYSTTNIKTIEVPGVVSCAPDAANKPNRSMTCFLCDFNDVFEVWVPEPGFVSVKRLDSGGGWGMDLTFMCQGEASLTDALSTIMVTGPIPTKSCASTCKPAAHEEMDGADVVHLQITGSTDDEKDTACCLACQQNSQCEFWVRDLGTTCWLKKDFRHFRASSERRGSFVCEPGTTDVSYPVFRDCILRDHTKEAEHQEMVGADVKRLQIMSYNQTEVEKDEQCAFACLMEPDCEYWVRDLGSTCWLKKDFRYFHTSDVRRGDFICEPGTTRNPPSSTPTSTTLSSPLPSSPSTSGCSVECGGGVQTLERQVLVPQRGSGKQCPALLTKQVACNRQSCACHNLKGEKKLMCRSNYRGKIRMWAGFKGNTMGAGEYVLSRTKDSHIAVHVCQQRHPRNPRITVTKGYRMKVNGNYISFNQQKTPNDDFSDVMPAANGKYVFGGIIGNDEWELVRRVGPGTTWHPSTDNLAGTETYGTPADHTANTTFSIPWGSCSFFLFATGDMQKWLIASQSSVSGTYSNEPRSVVRSSTNLNTYDVAWSSRPSYQQEPWISLIDYQSARMSGNILYGEAGYFSVPSNGSNVLMEHNGANVFCLKGEPGQCTSTPGWNNGYGQQSANGLNCSDYVAQGFCTGTSVAAADYAGAENNYPEHNCCECGKTAGAPRHSLVSGSHWGQRTGHSGGYTKSKEQFCLEDTSTISPAYQLGLGVVCCDATGRGTRPGCKTGTYAEAVAHCESLGQSLCTLNQLKSGSGEASGCGFDGHLVWSKTPCGATHPPVHPEKATGSYWDYPPTMDIQEVPYGPQEFGRTKLVFPTGEVIGGHRGRRLWIRVPPAGSYCQNVEGLCGAFNPASNYTDAYMTRSGVGGLYKDTFLPGPAGGPYQLEFAESWKVLPDSPGAMFTEAECPPGPPDMDYKPPHPFMDCPDLREMAEQVCSLEDASLKDECMVAVGMTCDISAALDVLDGDDEDDEDPNFKPDVEYPGPPPDLPAEDPELCPAEVKQEGVAFSNCHPQFKEYLLKVQGCHIDTCNCLHCDGLDPAYVQSLCQDPTLALQ